MAIALINKEWCGFEEDYRCSFVMDSEADAENLPECCVGSIAVVADTGGKIYMVNASGQWRGL